ncbi:MAG: DNA recombination/repair protein RecA [Candidatus Dormibacteraeota bacterium]|nr:DNA recombination/repair protein RecA [Candidatus Dormibacteraeota bacterium]
MPDRLQQAITVLQTRFGNAAPRPAQPEHPARPSGIDELDALTGIGGWPVGRLSLLAGPMGSGKRTIAQRSVAAASREGTVVYVDFPGRLDPEFLSRFDADLSRLLVVRPKHLKEGMASARVLARAGADLVCLDLPRARAAGLDAELPHLLHRIAEASCTLLLIHDADADDAVRYYASLILGIQRSAWVFRSDGDLEGLQVTATVMKNRLAPPGRQARWTIPYPLP